MKCPKCKKPTELQTKRTLANGRTVKRERYCCKCKSRFVSFEQFQADIDKAKEDQSEYVRRLAVISEQRLEALNEYSDLFRGLRQALDKAGK
jgi:transcriptional regulator NrdR family protein